MRLAEALPSANGISLNGLFHKGTRNNRSSVLWSGWFIGQSEAAKVEMSSARCTLFGNDPVRLCPCLPFCCSFVPRGCSLPNKVYEFEIHKQSPCIFPDFFRIFLDFFFGFFFYFFGFFRIFLEFFWIFFGFFSDFLRIFLDFFWIFSDFFRIFFEFFWIFFGFFSDFFRIFLDFFWIFFGFFRIFFGFFLNFFSWGVRRFFWVNNPSVCSHLSILLVCLCLCVFLVVLSLILVWRAFHSESSSVFNAVETRQNVSWFPSYRTQRLKRWWHKRRQLSPRYRSVPASSNSLRLWCQFVSVRRCFCSLRTSERLKQSLSFELNEKLSVNWQVCCLFHPRWRVDKEGALFLWSPRLLLTDGLLRMRAFT